MRRVLVVGELLSMVSIASCGSSVDRPMHVMLVLQSADCESRSADIAVVANHLPVDSVLWIGKQLPQSSVVSALSRRLPKNVGFGWGSRRLQRSLTDLRSAPRTPMVVVTRSGEAVRGFSLAQNRRDLRRQIETLTLTLSKP